MATFLEETTNFFSKQIEKHRHSILNSFWKEEAPVVKIRELVRYLLNDDNIT